jgi:hypothetical protein
MSLVLTLADSATPLAFGAAFVAARAIIITSASGLIISAGAAAS